MKTVLLVGSYAPSLINFRGPLIKQMTDAGHRVIACAPDLTLEIQAQLAQLGAQSRSISLGRDKQSITQDLSYLRALVRLIKAEAPDLLLSYTIKPNIWGGIAARICGVRSVAMVTGLGFAFTDNGRKPTLKSRVLHGVVRRLYRTATNANWKVVFQNPDDPVDFQKSGCLRDMSKVEIVNGSGVDLLHFAPAPLPASTKENPVFLMVARLLFNKGVSEYAQACALVKQTHPHARFVLLGPKDSGPDGIPADMIARWQQAGLDYVGPQHDVRSALAQCSTFVLPSYREGTPRSVLEAMAVGRAVITTDVPGCRETVQDKVNGYVIPARDVAALACAMRKMMDPQRQHDMGQASLRIARAKYDVTVVNTHLIKILEL